MQTVKPLERNSLGTLFQRLRGAHEAELFGPRGRLPRRGEPDTSRNTALLVLAGLILVGLALRLAVPRGIWLDEAISIHQARLSLHGLFRNLYYGDRQPPLYHLTLWLTIRAFGDGEFAVRLPSLIAGTLVIPVLYELGRELYDRRTGLIAAAFAAVSPLLIWYSQEVRMYEFVALFGLLALLTQLRAIRNGTMLNWAAYILATAALLWSHYFGLLLIGVQQLVFVGVLIHRKRSGEPVKPLALGLCLLGRGARHAARAPAGVRPPPVPGHVRVRPARRAGPMTTCRSTRCSRTWPGRSGATSPMRLTVLLAAMWPLFLLGSLVLLGRGGSRQTMSLAAAAIALVVLLIVVSVFDRSYFEVRNFLILVPLVLLLIARLVTGWIRQPRARLLVAGARRPDVAGRPGRSAAEQGQSAAVRLPRRDPGHQGQWRTEQPRPVRAPRHALRARVLRARPPQPAPLAADDRGRRRGAPCSSSPRSRATRRSSTETNKVVGQLTFFRTLVRRFKTPQTLVWEFQ